MVRSIAEELEQLSSKGLYRSMRMLEGRQSAHVSMNGRDLLLFCSNNYLGLADHPLLAEASIRAVESFGTSSSASRLVSGTMELHEQLESAVAHFKQTESALLFNSGYAANTGIIPALVGRGDVVFCDRLNHASIIDGIMLSGARLVRYPHNDYRTLEQQMDKNRCTGRKLIVTDGVFSMDGDIAPLRELVNLKKASGAFLMLDDAHGTGVLGEGGRGTAEVLGVMDGVDIQMGTFGKALGSFGAYAAVSAEMRELFLNRARSFIFSTSLPPGVLAASVAALQIVQSGEGVRLRERLSFNRDYFIRLLTSAGFSVTDGGTQIIPLLTGDAEVTMQFSDALLEEGIFVQGIRPPTVPPRSCRLRFTIMATHSASDLEYAVERTADAGRRLGVI